MSPMKALGKTLSENTTVSFRVATAWGIVSSLVVGTVSATAAVFAAKEWVNTSVVATTRDLRQELRAENERTQAAINDKLPRYVTREELLMLLDERFDRFETRLIERIGQ